MIAARMRVIGVAAVLLATAMPSAAQQVYRYKDADGRWVYTDRPPANRQPAETVSVAVGNALLRQAQPLKTVAAEGEARFAAIAALIREWQPTSLVIGVPFHPDGAAHDNTQRARRFGRQLHGLNSSGTAPAAWTRDYFLRKHGDKFPMRGWDSVTVPGAVAGWVALSERFGKLPFADLLAPAIELAERGYGVGVVTADKWAKATPLLQDQPGFAEAFMPRGRAPLPGERFVLAAAGQTLRKIAATTGDAFYRAEITKAIAALQAPPAASPPR